MTRELSCKAKQQQPRHATPLHVRSGLNSDTLSTADRSRNSRYLRKTPARRTPP